MLDRQSVSAKISDFLEGRISPEDFHQWAFALALSDKYKDLGTQDALLSKIIACLFGLEMANPKRDRRLRRTLLYYQKCLEGKAEFRLVVEEDPKTKKHTITEYLLVVRIYVLVFAVVALFLQSIPLLKIILGLTPNASLAVWENAILRFLPHVFYSLVLIVPQRITARNWRFYLTALILSAGMVYYWWTTVVFVMKLSFHMVFVMVFLPFGALPATLALVMLVIRKMELIRNERMQVVRLR